LPARIESGAGTEAEAEAVAESVADGTSMVSETFKAVGKLAVLVLAGKKTGGRGVLRPI